MRLSLVIAAHNEGASLWKTVQSCVETCAGLDYEIVVADDASWDGCVDETLKRFPQLRVVRHDKRLGPSPTKDLGGRNARGDVLVFLDGHTKPEPGAIQRLIESVELHRGNAIITPAITGLDVGRWKPASAQIGHGYFLELERFDCGWLPLSDLRETTHHGRTFYESPAAIGCAFAIHRELYDDLHGFDPHMLSWGVEDLDFSLKCWLLGHPILHDPAAVVAHRFRKRFDNFDVPIQDLITNQLRMAYKNFTPGVWREWIDRCRRRHPGRIADHPEGLWACAWRQFEERRESAEQERAYLMFRRVRDEFWYAERFNLLWPRLQAERFQPAPATFEALAAQASPSPSPAPTCGSPPKEAGKTDLACPPNEWTWTSLMNTRHWYHFNDGNKKWNWTLLSGGIWQVKIQEPPPATKNRHKFDLMTYCCFSDFNLKLDFRCPNVRAMWDENMTGPDGSPCDDPLRGIRNWGNSGIYIFNSYEVQIHDSYKGPDAAPDESVPASGSITLEIDPSTAGGPSCIISTNELCGSMYKFRHPDKNYVKKSVGNPPTGAWNSMEIGFMAPRYDATGEKVRCATITVKINGKSVYTHLGIPDRTGRFKEGHWGKVADTRYGMGWEMGKGPIVLQEHDNKVQFKNIQINPAWIPTVGGGKDDPFSTTWQRKYDATLKTCVDP